MTASGCTVRDLVLPPFNVLNRGSCLSARLLVDLNTRNAGTGRLPVEHVYEHANMIPAASVYWHTQYFNDAAQLLYVKVATRTDFRQYRKIL